jgi:hypothetical protein
MILGGKRKIGTIYSFSSEKINKIMNFGNSYGIKHVAVKFWFKILHVINALAYCAKSLISSTKKQE